MILFLVVIGLLVWCLASLPLAIAVGRAFGAAGHGSVHRSRDDFDLAA